MESPNAFSIEELRALEAPFSEWFWPQTHIWHPLPETLKQTRYLQEQSLIIQTIRTRFQMEGIAYSEHT